MAFGLHQHAPLRACEQTYREMVRHRTRRKPDRRLFSEIRSEPAFEFFDDASGAVGIRLCRSGQLGEQLRVFKRRMSDSVACCENALFRSGSGRSQLIRDEWGRKGRSKEMPTVHEPDYTAQADTRARWKFPPRINSMFLALYLRRTKPSVRSKIFFA